MEDMTSEDTGSILHYNSTLLYLFQAAVSLAHASANVSIVFSAGQKLEQLKRCSEQNES